MPFSEKTVAETLTGQHLGEEILFLLLRAGERDHVDEAEMILRQLPERRIRCCNDLDDFR